MRHVPSLTLAGIDLVPEMLGIARVRLGSRVHLVAGNAEGLPFDRGTFDIVTSSSSFHYWLDPGRGLDEISRVLRPGGRLVITDWCDDYLACRICDIVLRVFNRAHQRILSESA